jgi:membrane protein YqaA with SNARE-associated domain
VKLHPVIWFRKAGLVTMAFLKPFGFWGLGALSFVDSGLFPIPPTMDLVLIGYVSANPSRVLLYAFAAAVGSGLGSLIPYFIGRAGGELFLLKRINRARYEKLRDRFEKQEFLAIAIPAMIPPPFPLKLFEFAAGVFEMKPLPFALAITCGKFLRFLVVGIVTVVYGPSIIQTVGRTLHEHLGLVLAAVGAIIVALALFVTRKIFDRRNGTRLPIEEADKTV